MSMMIDELMSDTALHEAGHAVVLLSCGYGEQLHGASLTPDDPLRSGYVRYSLEDDLILELPDMCFPSSLNLAAALVLTSLGGFAAEVAIGSRPEPTAAHSDMARAITMIHYLATTEPQGVIATYSMLTQPQSGHEDPLVEPCGAALEDLHQTVQRSFGRSLMEIMEDMIKEAMRRVEANIFAVMSIARELIRERHLDGARLREIAEAAPGWCGGMGAPNYFNEYPAGWRR